MAAGGGSTVGDSKALSSSSHHTIGTTTSSHRGSGGRRISRPTTTTTSRAPVLLEFTETTLRCGLVGETSPKDIVPLLSTSNSSSGVEPHTGQDSAAVWYRYLVPILKHAYQRLGMDARNRKALVLFRGFDDTSIPRNVEEALLAVLLGNIGVSAVNLQCSSWSMIPYCLPMISHMLVVSVGLYGVSCFVHACGENLPFTYQHVDLTRKEDCPSDMETAGTASLSSDEFTYLDLSNPDSVMVCLLKSLEACPMTTRKLVISNIVFAGTGLFQCPHVPLLVVKQLKAVLVAAHDQPTVAVRRKLGVTTTEEAEVEDPTKEAEESNKAKNHHSSNVLVPINLKSLAGLEANVGLLKYNISPDMLVWLGTSQWATRWYGRDPLLQKLKWYTEWRPKT